MIDQKTFWTVVAAIVVARLIEVFIALQLQGE
jgi:hypothetical protein